MLRPEGAFSKRDWERRSFRSVVLCYASNKLCFGVSRRHTFVGQPPDHNQNDAPLGRGHTTTHMLPRVRSYASPELRLPRA